MFIRVLELPAWIGRTVMMLMTLGRPLVLLFTCALEGTQDRANSAIDSDARQAITIEIGRKLNLAIIAARWVALASNSSTVAASVQSHGALAPHAQLAVRCSEHKVIVRR